MTQDSVVYLVADDGGHEDVAHELRRAGWRVERFEGVEAFLASRDVERPGCLLIEKSHCSNGFDPAEALRARGDEIPFIRFNGADGGSTTVELPGHGPIDVWPPSADSAALSDRVAKAMRIDHARREQRERLSRCQDELARLSEPARAMIDWMCVQRLRMA